jgi:hypothetical protein
MKNKNEISALINTIRGALVACGVINVKRDAAGNVVGDAETGEPVILPGKAFTVRVIAVAQPKKSDGSLCSPKVKAIVRTLFGEGLKIEGISSPITTFDTIWLPGTLDQLALAGIGPSAVLQVRMSNVGVKINEVEPEIDTVSGLPTKNGGTYADLTGFLDAFYVQEKVVAPKFSTTPLIETPAAPAAAPAPAA